MADAYGFTPVGTPWDRAMSSAREREGNGGDLFWWNVGIFLVHAFDEPQSSSMALSLRRAIDAIENGTYRATVDTRPLFQSRLLTTLTSEVDLGEARRVALFLDGHEIGWETRLESPTSMVFSLRRSGDEE